MNRSRAADGPAATNRDGATDGAAGRGRAHLVVPVLAVLGTLLLGASAAIELSNEDPLAELWSGVAAGATFLLAIALSRGSSAEVLALRARLLVGAGLSALLAVAALWQATERTAPRVLLLLVPVCLLFTTAVLALREAAGQRREARLRELRWRQAGEEAELRRWVRDLHDDTLQELAAVQVLLATAAGSGDPGAQAKGIAEARELVGRQIQGLRRLISRMRPLALDTLGLSAALEDLSRHAGDASGIALEVRLQPLPRLPLDTETSIYRVVQEALTNAVRHSGARRITIETRSAPGWLDIAVRDDGHGQPGRFVPGHGLVGMRERAEAIGADLVIVGGDGGTEVRLRVPHPDAQRPGRLSRRGPAPG